MPSKYFREDYRIGRIFAEAVKITTLLSGVYSVAQDEVNLVGAIGAATVYVAADAIKEALREAADAYRAQTLEDRLKQ